MATGQTHSRYYFAVASEHVGAGFVIERGLGTVAICSSRAREAARVGDVVFVVSPAGSLAVVVYIFVSSAIVKPSKTNLYERRRLHTF